MFKLFLGDWENHTRCEQGKYFMLIVLDIQKWCFWTSKSGACLYFSGGGIPALNRAQGAGAPELLQVVLDEVTGREEDHGNLGTYTFGRSTIPHKNFDVWQSSTTYFLHKNSEPKILDI